MRFFPRLVRGFNPIEESVVLEGQVGAIVFIARHDVAITTFNIWRLAQIDPVLVDDEFIELIRFFLLCHFVFVNLQVRGEHICIILQFF